MLNNPKIKKLAAIVIGLLVFVVIVVVAFRFMSTRASDVEPRDVVVASIEKNSVKISWATGVDSQGVVEYGTTPTALSFFAPESVKGKSHTIDLTLLSPNTTYYFDIRVGDKKFDNGGVPWTFTTKSSDKSAGSLTPTQIVELTPTVVASATATPAVTASASSPTPIQSLKIPDSSSGCNETDCAAIKTKLGKGCSTQDYFKCVKALTPSPTP